MSDIDAIRLIHHLGRGGAWQHFWTNPPKTSQWFPAGKPAGIPADAANVYFGVHPVYEIPKMNSRGEPAKPKAVRTQVEYVAAINCLFSEFDQDKGATLETIENLNPRPSAVIGSGGGWHCYWMLADPFVIDGPESLERAKQAQYGWVEFTGGDPDAKDLARVLRVPGTFNYKYDPPRPVETLWAEFDRLYQFEKLESMIPAKPAPIVSNNGYHPPAGTDLATWAYGLLERLDPWRCDQYKPWVEVGMALSELGGAGLSMWENWSQGSPKHKPGECAEKWPTFKSGSGITLGSLYHWAEEDDPGGLRKPARAVIEYNPPEPELPNEELPIEAPAKKEIKTVWTIAELMQTVFPEPQWAVPELIPVGLSFLAGRPKLGKSWLALQLAHAVGTGGYFLGKHVKKGNVLFLALEDSARRLKSRAEKQRIPGDADITFATTWRPLPAGGLDDLMIEIAREIYTVIIIDTLSRAVGRADQQDLAEMTSIVGSLQSMAQNNNIAMLVNDHHRKNNGFESSPVDDILGSTGKAAVADALMGLYREQGKHGATLKITGRDIEEQELALQWDGLLCCWQSMGSAFEVRTDTLKADIMNAIRELEEMGELPTTTRIATHISGDKGNVSRMLSELVGLGKVRRGEKIGRERPYILVEVIQQ
jgi:hypothetical protein